MFLIRHKQTGRYVAPVGSAKHYVANVSSARTFFSEAQAAAECCGAEEVIPYPTKRTRPHVVTAQHVMDYFAENGQSEARMMVAMAIREIGKVK